ncbi:MAG: hypothetical protein ABFS32_16245 [Bacteroidota bacterium]
MRKLLIILTLFCILMNSFSLAQSECRMLFFDEFNDNSYNWPIKEYEKKASYSMENGYYYIECFQKRKASMALHIIEIDENENFEIEASIQKESTAKRNEYGIILGFSDIENFYGFVINDKGEFRFFETRDGERESIFPWTESEYIRRGIGTSNKLMIIKEGEDLKLYANDSILTVTPFQSFYGNLSGLYVQRKQRIAVDYFRILYSKK